MMTEESKQYVDETTQEMAIAAALAMVAAKRSSQNVDAQESSFEFDVMVNTRYVMKMFHEGSLPRLLLSSFRLIATVKQVEFEESSQRFVIHFQCEGGEPETVRTLRTDTYYGADIKRMVNDITGRRCLIYKTNVPVAGKEGERGRTVRVTPYIMPLS